MIIPIQNDVNLMSGSCVEQPNNLKVLVVNSSLMKYVLSGQRDIGRDASEEFGVESNVLLWTSVEKFYGFILIALRTIVLGK